MRGEVWTEYILIVLSFALGAVIAFSYVFPPVKEAIVCGSIHEASLKEVINGELNSMVTHELKDVSCDLAKKEVNIVTDFPEENLLKRVAKDVLNEFGEQNVTVRVVR